jgi:hypothetical protein
MAESIEAKEIGEKLSRALRLWAGILISPIAAAIQLQTLWLTSEYGCQTADFTWNHVVSISALIVSAVGVAIAVSEYRKWAHAGDNSGPEHDSRRRFMAMVGLMSSALFTVLIFALWLPTIMGVPCGK